jgi:micrococcal nuclease
MMRAIAIPALIVGAAFVAFGAHAANFQGRARVIDGDTIAIGSTHFRLNGVAAPELSDPGGQAAKRWMRHFLAGHIVRCQFNGQRSYNRLVAICYANGQDIGAAIIRAGFARDCPHYSHGRYRADERAARRAGHDLARRYPLPRYCRNFRR